MNIIKNNYEKETEEITVKSPINTTKKSGIKGLFKYSGIFISILIIFVVIAVFTVKINIVTSEIVFELALGLAILLFCSYSMYVNGADSGMKFGKESSIFIETQKKFDIIKQQVIDSKQQSRTREFCRYYINQELKETRANILSSVGIDYEVYLNKYVGKDIKVLKADETLYKAQIDAIIRANKTQPITLTPDIIYRKSQGTAGRQPLGIKPEIKRGVHYITKLIITVITSMLTVVIMFDAVITPTWATFAECCLNLLPVVLNGFWGYKMGYDNITVDTVNYTNDQIELMQQFLQYISEDPIASKTSNTI